MLFSRYMCCVHSLIQLNGVRDVSDGSGTISVAATCNAAGTAWEYLGLDITQVSCFNAKPGVHLTPLMYFWQPTLASAPCSKAWVVVFGASWTHLTTPYKGITVSESHEAYILKPFFSLPKMRGLSHHRNSDTIPISGVRKWHDRCCRWLLEEDTSVQWQCRSRYGDSMIAWLYFHFHSTVRSSILCLSNPIFH